PRVRPLVTESMLLAVWGGGAALMVAAWARNLLWSMRPPAFKYASFYPDLNGRVLAFTLLVSIATSLLFGLTPALRATRADLNNDLKERAGKASSPGRWRQRSLLGAGQVAFSVIALVGAGLFVRSMLLAGRIDPGFAASQLGTVLFNAADQEYNEARGREYQRRAIELALATPGVAAAA